MAGLSLEDFLGHATRAQGGKNKYLSKWKKNNPPTVLVWLHTKAIIMPLWRHGVPRLMEVKDEDGDKRIEVWGGDWSCWEPEEVLKQQYFRDRETGEREVPPTICPACRLVEHVRERVESGNLNWTTPIFKFVGDDASKKVIIHAAGMYNGFNGDLSDEEKDELKKHRIFRNDVWRENMMAKLSYGFVVVDNSNLTAGPQIAIETSSLGDCVKKVIADAMMEAEDEGNPYTNPYAIRWAYDANAKDLNKKYAANKMSKVPFTEQVRKLIVDTAPPDLSRLDYKLDPTALKEQLQEVCLVKDIPWSEIFGDAEKAWPKIKERQEAKKEKVTDKSTEFNTDEFEDTPKGPPSRKETKSKSDKKPTVAALKPKTVATKNVECCPSCGEPITASDKNEGICPHCGELFNVVDKVLGKDELPY